MPGIRFAAGLPTVFARRKTTSARYVAARFIDPTFEKLMEGYKHLFKVVAVQELILASPDTSLPLPFLASAAQKLHLNRGASHFVHAFPRVFSLHYDPAAAQPVIRLTPAAAAICSDESSAASESAPAAVNRLVRLLSMSSSKCLPLRAVFKVWRELGLPDNFEISVVARNPAIFALRPNPREPNTHLLDIVSSGQSPNINPAVEEWRHLERSREGSKTDESELKFGFKQGYPPGMRLTKNFRAKTKEWQRLPYASPYETIIGGGKRMSKARMKALEKRAVGMAHEFLSLTVEKMVEVEKISHFRKWFGIEMNIRDLFLDHPGIFYLSTKGKRHTVFLREAYERGRLIDPNPIYEVRMRLLQLVLMRRKGMGGTDENVLGRKERMGAAEEVMEEDKDEDGISDSECS